jgi:uncharacterized protein
LKLEHGFEVPASPDQTLELLLDAERVVPCMPGAKLLEVVDDRTWKAELEIKLGPVAMQFLADVKMLELDETAKTVKLGVSARDTRGKGGAEGTVDSALQAADGGGTKVAMQTGAPEERAAAVEEAQKPVSGISLAVHALVGAIKRLFGIGRERGETT